MHIYYDYSEDNKSIILLQFTDLSENYRPNVRRYIVQFWACDQYRRQIECDRDVFYYAAYYTYANCWYHLIWPSSFFKNTTIRIKGIIITKSFDRGRYSNLRIARRGRERCHY